MKKLMPTKLTKDIFCAGALVGVTVGLGAVLATANVAADDSAVTTTTIEVPSSCSLESTIDTAHVAEVPNGIYSGTSDYPNGIGQTTLRVYCNDNEGFSIYAVGYTGEEIGATNSTKLVGDDTNQTIDTGTATSGNSSAWAMKLNTVSSPTPTYPITLLNGYDSFSSVPANYAKVATRTGGTDTGVNAEGSALTTTYAVYIASNQTADTYRGKVKYTMVHPASEVPLQPQVTDPGYIAYYPNASTAVGSMSDNQGGPVQQLTSNQTTATLLAPNFSRDGYGFAGWSDAFDWDTNPNAHFYGPNQDITFTAGQYSGTNNGLSLYAVWVESAGTFQSDASTVCSSLTAAPASGNPTMASVSALTDERDDQTYAIAKLADGNCWMIENLRLEAENTRSAADEALAQGYGKYSDSGTDYGDFIGLADAESSDFSNSTTANSLYYSGTQSGSATENIGTSDYPAYRMPRYNHINTDSTSATPTRAESLTKSTTYTDTAGANIYGYGNYYTWHAAIANTNYYSGPTATDAAGKTSETVGTSLCPTGWKLPYGRSTGNGIVSGGFYNLGTELSATTSDATSSKKWRSFPNNFVYSGYFGTASASNRGTRSYYWSSTAYRNDYSYRLYLGSTTVNPGTGYYGKYVGGSLRCLAGS